MVLQVRLGRLYRFPFAYEGPGDWKTATKERKEASHTIEQFAQVGDWPRREGVVEDDPKGIQKIV